MDPLSALGPQFQKPPPEFGLCPFWFWNDYLDESEIVRQMREFRSHGVNAFVLHPRVGLPQEIGWMSERMLHFVRHAVVQAEQLGMGVVLYDEGMYPSGSSSGQVVAQAPQFACRGLVRRPVDAPPEHTDEQVLEVADGWCVVDRPIRSTIRGLHYIGDGPEEESPAAADLLNPDAVRCFLSLVYGQYYETLGDHFGRTILGVFTDEPSMLGRPSEPDALPSTRDLLDHAERLTGSPIPRPLYRLWEDGSTARRQYDRLARYRLEKTFYAQLSEWCHEHGLPLMGHPEPPDQISVLRWFDVPGQDLVWGWVRPGPSAIQGPQSTQAKCASSAARLYGKRRNSNEFAGAYGHDLTYQEFRWLAHWCLIRGANLLVPHAFYYSIRGPRRDERPPDVGPHSAWWDRFPDFAMECSRLCWLNTDSELICPVAILENDQGTPWRAAQACLRSQVDFEYVPRNDPQRWASRYELVVNDGGDRWPGALEYTDFSSDEEFVQALLAKVDRTLSVESHPDLRLRRVRKNGCDVTMVHNEGTEHLKLRLEGCFDAIDPVSLRVHRLDGFLVLQPFEFTLLTPGN